MKKVTNVGHFGYQDCDIYRKNIVIGKYHLNQL